MGTVKPRMESWIAGIMNSWWSWIPDPAISTGTEPENESMKKQWSYSILVYIPTRVTVDMN